MKNLRRTLLSFENHSIRNPFSIPLIYYLQSSILFESSNNPKSPFILNTRVVLLLVFLVDRGLFVVNQWVLAIFCNLVPAQKVLSSSILSSVDGGGGKGFKGFEIGLRSSIITRTCICLKRQYWKRILTSVLTVRIA